MNFLQTPRISSDSVAENIITCLEWGVSLKMRWTSLRMSANIKKINTKGESIENGYESFGKVDTQAVQHLVALV